MRGLTVINKELERAEILTAPGMAHWAGSGPEGAMCGKCRFHGYTYVKTNGDHANKRSSCESFYKMTGRHGGALDEKQIGCKYFSKKPQA
jgi:hypothetical protein